MAPARKRGARRRPCTLPSPPSRWGASTARGPGYSDVPAKPDIGAPGASLSAESGTGTGNTAFGGTSGAAPMVRGSAALLLQANPTLSPTEVKAKLMNSADTNIFVNPAISPGLIAPITRIGGGEVRDDEVAVATAAARTTRMRPDQTLPDGSHHGQDS